MCKPSALPPQEQLDKHTLRLRIANLTRCVSACRPHDLFLPWRRQSEPSNFINQDPQRRCRWTNTFNILQSPSQLNGVNPYEVQSGILRFFLRSQYFTKYQQKRCTCWAAHSISTCVATWSDAIKTAGQDKEVWSADKLTYLLTYLLHGAESFLRS